jgi:hypothetical protein
VNTSLLATAELTFHPPARDAHDGIRGPLAERQPRVLVLTFSEASKVETTADRVFTLANGGGVLELSQSIEYSSGHPTPQRTFLHCMRNDGMETLEYADNVLSWHGSHIYWNECSRTLAHLGKNNVNAQISLMFGTADQAVLVRFRKSSVTQ